METRLRTTFLAFRPICQNIFLKNHPPTKLSYSTSSTLSYSQKYSAILLKYTFLKISKMAPKMANIENLGLTGERFSRLSRSRVCLCHLQQVLLVHILPMFRNKEVISVMIFYIWLNCKSV